ncbi:MAG: MFS transporter [Caldilineaceae bacterium]|nr:MFS transporter [Caldilineaceae bacterium]
MTRFANEPTYEHKWLILAALAGVVLMASVLFSSAAVVLPAIVQEFDIDFAVGQWVLLSYTLAQTSIMPIVGRLGDMVGKRPILLGGTLAFVVASILPGLAPTVELLLLFRVLQAASAAFALALNFGIVTETFPPSERGKALGVFGALFAAGSIAGPMVAGVLLETLSWRWIFFVSLPLGGISLVLSWRYLPKTRPPGRQSFDWPGSLFLFAGLLALMLYMTFGDRTGFLSLGMLGLLAVSLLLLWQFVRNEARAQDPLVDLSLFRNAQFSTNLAIRVIANMTVGGLWFLFPFYLGNILLIEPLLAGMLLTTFWVCFGATVMISGALADRFGVRLITGAGLAILAFGCYTVSTLSAASSAVDFVLRVAPVALGFGISHSPTNSAVMSSAPRERLGIASGTITIGWFLGRTAGVAALGALWASRVHVYSGPELGGAVTEAAAGPQIAALRDVSFAAMALVGVTLAMIAWESMNARSAVRPSRVPL